MGRLFITGDTHGTQGIGRLGQHRFPQGAALGREDHVVIAGDFGCPWYGPESKRDRSIIDFIESLPFTVLVVDGNHENHALLDSLPEIPYCGGMAHRIAENCLHLMRGYVFDIGGRALFAMGGAMSTDRAYGVENETWWRREMPSSEEYARAIENLETRRWQVDYVVTHCAPANFQAAVNPCFANDRLTEFLFREVERRLTYRRWYFGHYHEDKALDSRGYHAECLYDNIAEVPDRVSR